MNTETIMQAYHEVDTGNLEVVEFSGSEVVMINKELYRMLANNISKKLLDLKTESNSSWVKDPDRMGGQFTQDELDNTGWK